MAAVVVVVAVVSVVLMAVVARPEKQAPLSGRPLAMPSPHALEGTVEDAEAEDVGVPVGWLRREQLAAVERQQAARQVTFSQCAANTVTTITIITVTVAISSRSISISTSSASISTMTITPATPTHVRTARARHHLLVPVRCRLRRGGVHPGRPGQRHGRAQQPSRQRTRQQREDQRTA
jgi:hypothetical protein